MISGFPILSVMLGVPLLGAVWCLAAPGEGEAKAAAARWGALIATAVNLLLGVVLWASYDPAGPQWQFQESAPLFGRFAWSLGIDGIALLLIVLTVFLLPLCVLASWKAISKRVPEYMAVFLLTEIMCLGVFMAQDLFLFYVFFEGGLIPMFLTIGIWGGARRIYASYKFFLYTLLGSLLMLIAMLWMVRDAGGTTYIPALQAHNFPAGAQTWLFLAFLASFGVKMPMWPVHTWLPDAHVEAPTAGSVILAGVLLKLAGYGFLRFSLPMFPEGSAQFMWLIFALSMIATVYTSLVALVQQDMKKLIAYSSVAHMALVTFGLFAFNPRGIEGAYMVMLGHGLVSAALFLCVGVVYDRLHTREISQYGGIANNMPAYATIFLFFTMASIGLPGLSNFVGEFLSMMGTYEQSSWAAFIAVTGIITGAAYMLYLYKRIAFGPVTNPHAAEMPDLEPREYLILVPLVIATIWMGVYPKSFLDPIHRDVGALLARIDRARPAPDAQLARVRPAPAATGAAAGEGVQ